jgi:hypothetical protein
MASTVTSATLTVTLTEKVNLNGMDQGATTQLSIADINEVSKRIITVPSGADTTIATFAAAVSTSAQAYDVNDVKYIRITNLDDTNPVNIAMVGASDNAQFVVGAGHSLVFGSPDDFMLGEADTTPAFASFEDLASIIVDSGSNAVDIELFIASV